MIEKDILCGAVDMHVHAAPDVQPRKYHSGCAASAARIPR